MKRFLPFVIVVFVAAATVVSATVFFRTKKSEQALLSAGVLVPAAGGHTLGSEDASVTLEEFGDYQCPPCGNISGALNQIEREFRPKLKVVFRNFPLPVHSHAREAAFVAEAAGLQGKFWEMHDLLYAKQPEWSVAPEAEGLFENYARGIGLDLARLKKDTQSNEVRERIESDQKRGMSVHVEKTPSIFVNGHVVPPEALTLVGLKNAVEAAITNPSAL